MPLLTSALTLQPSPISLLRVDDVPHPERAVARNDLVKVRRGVYAPAEEWRSLPPWTRYLAQVHAALLLHPDLVPSHESAVALHGGPVFGNPGVVHVLAPATGASRLVSGVRTHTTTDHRALVLISGIAVSAPAEAAVDVARARHPAIGLAVADAMLRRDDTVSREELARINATRSSSRGRDIARWPLSRATSLAETAFESVSRGVIEWLGFSAPELQKTFVTQPDEVDRVDFVWEEASLAGEADGDFKFDGRFGDAATLLKQQRSRDARLRGHLRAVAHWGWQDTTTFTPLRTLLHGAGLRATAPENSAALMSMRRVLVGRAPHPTDPR
ncbi:hypothetical protein [Microbacterium sp. LWS13-1.2]|uniref:Transcriptional regulator, AbiEi antitoxin, Type IV TA system n=1 Tax=Microbacterium sp. LWS13-1.2 TaxID=3135264 RepID=A0AAU6S8S1_9MICO